MSCQTRAAAYLRAVSHLHDPNCLHCATGFQHFEALCCFRDESCIEEGCFYHEHDGVPTGWFSGSAVHQLLGSQTLTHAKTCDGTALMLFLEAFFHHEPRGICRADLQNAQPCYSVKQALCQT